MLSAANENKLSDGERGGNDLIFDIYQVRENQGSIQNGTKIRRFWDVFGRFEQAGGLGEISRRCSAAEPPEKRGKMECAPKEAQE